jgi:hypothetical protein
MEWVFQPRSGYQSPNDVSLQSFRFPECQTACAASVISLMRELAEPKEYSSVQLLAVALHLSVQGSLPPGSHVGCETDQTPESDGSAFLGE